MMRVMNVKCFSSEEVMIKVEKHSIVFHARSPKYYTDLISAKGYAVSSASCCSCV